MGVAAASSSRIRPIAESAATAITTAPTTIRSVVGEPAGIVVRGFNDTTVVSRTSGRLTVAVCSSVASSGLAFPNCMNTMRSAISTKAEAIQDPRFGACLRLLRPPPGSMSQITTTAIIAQDINGTICPSA